MFLNMIRNTNFLTFLLPAAWGCYQIAFRRQQEKWMEKKCSRQNMNSLITVTRARPVMTEDRNKIYISLKVSVKEA